MKTGQEASQGRGFLVGRGVNGKRGSQAFWHGLGQGHGLGGLQLFSLLCPEKEKAKQTPLIPPPTWQGLPAGLEVVHSYEVAGQVKHRPLTSHDPVCSPDFFGDDVKGAKGGNPDSRQVKEK